MVIQYVSCAVREAAGEGTAPGSTARPAHTPPVPYRQDTAPRFADAVRRSMAGRLDVAGISDLAVLGAVLCELTGHGLRTAEDRACSPDVGGGGAPEDAEPGAMLLLAQLQLAQGAREVARRTLWDALALSRRQGSGVHVPECLRTWLDAFGMQG